MPSNRQRTRNTHPHLTRLSSLHLLHESLQLLNPPAPTPDPPIRNRRGCGTASKKMNKDGEVESPNMPPEEVDRPQTGTTPHIAAAPPKSSTAGTDENDGNDYEFAFVVRDNDTDVLMTADEIFSNGQIRSVYPVFSRNLVIEGAGDGDEVLGNPVSCFAIDERELVPLTPSYSDDDLKGLHPETYCVWKPGSSMQCRKSGSTGSVCRWRIRDLLVRRSQSDGKKRFVLVTSEEKPVAAMVKRHEYKGKGKHATEVDIATAQQRCYHRNGQGGTARRAGGGLKSFLPYKPDILGFFASVKGISRLQHPL